MLAQASAAIVAASKTAAPPVSVRTNRRSGVSRLRAHSVRQPSGPISARGPSTLPPTGPTMPAKLHHPRARSLPDSASADREARMTTLTPAGPAPEPIQIADLRQAGLSIRQIAWRLGRAPPAISRELRRNAAGRRDDRPFEAHRRAAARPAPVTGGGSRPTTTGGSWSPSFWPTGGARGRSTSPAAAVPRAAGDVVVSPGHVAFPYRTNWRSCLAKLRPGEPGSLVGATAAVIAARS